MPECLAVTANQIDFVTANSRPGAQLLHRLNIELSQQKIDFTKIRCTGAFPAGKAQNFFPRLRRKGLKHKTQLLNF